MIDRFLKWQNEALDVDPIEVHIPGLPGGMDGLRIAVLADLHMPGQLPYHARILQAVRDARPDCIVVAGDTIDESTRLVDSLGPFFAYLSGIAPTIAILGNNDCLPALIHALRDMYRAAGVTLLENETRLLDTRGGPLRITGLMDPRAKTQGIEPEHAAAPEAYTPLGDILPPQAQTPSPLGKSKTEPPEAIPSILLIHRPNLVRAYAPLRPSLAIAGHVHGGQFRLPLIGGLYGPDQGLFPRLSSGLYVVDGTQLLVSRGLGNHRFPLRLNNPPHLPIAILRRA